MAAAEELHRFREELAEAVIRVQMRCDRAGVSADDILPAVITSLIDMAAFLHHHSVANPEDTEPEGFLAACRQIITAEWSKPHHANDWH